MVTDPLTILPPEIVLRILDFAPISAVASLTTVSKAWRGFIDVTHQDAIYSSESKTTQPPGGVRDFSLLCDTTTSFTQFYKDTTSWKDLCRRQTLLSRNWADPHPVVRESVLQVGNDPVWRFRPDFKRRIFISTSQAGGLNVTDMDSGQVLWRLPSTLDQDDDAVRPYAHLEYQDGMAVFDREGDAVEVWQADFPGATRGEFRRIAILDHDCQTRGFQLSYGTLCVVSTQGQGFVYDMTERPPRRTTQLSIEQDAVGHLDQSHDVVIYSMGARGYHVYDKKSGAFMGALQPMHCTERYHILRPPRATTSATAALLGGSHPGRVFPLGKPSRETLVPISIAKGPLPPPTDPEHVRSLEDEWGAGMLDGDLFVGFSRAGRVFVCSNWRKALHDQSSLAHHSSVIECESDGSSFDLGGWLSVRNHRVMFEIQDRVYIVALDDNDKVQDVDCPARGSYCLITSSMPQLTVPVSFMALYDDAIMTTYTTLAWRQPNGPDGIIVDQGHSRIFPTKSIRIVSLAPSLSNDNDDGTSKVEAPQDSRATGGGLWDPDQEDAPPEDVLRSRAGLLQLISMLEGEIGAEDDDDDEGLEVMLTDFQNGDVDDDWEDVDDDENENEEQELSNQHPDAHERT
ncbi:hypothetical protein FE257_002035 [Aspergillus nanangensis]|uniref:F-box domain-containing protein n=1 Tax=Aspergillus nanangensis TaxID=2582783 RepID=A0AAD4GY51_ASPNN|nr:hypothetical protein FE257_002035 [Aspergillus nanangensis]